MAGIKFNLMVVAPEIIVFILATFVAVIGFGFKIIQSNTKAIESINITLTEIQTSNKYEEKDCEQRHAYISGKFKDHGLRIEDHERRISKLEQK